jgi:uncharacterized membrane protein
MSRKALGIASLIMVAVLLAVTLAVGPSLPAGLELPTHWTLSGRPDGFSGKWTALLMPTVMAIFLSTLFWFLPELEPRVRNLSRSTGLYLWTWAGLLLVVAAAELAILSGALHWHLSIERLMAGTIGLLFMLIGNQLGKSRSMYIMGIRTPWTLASEEVWIKTHRLGGKLMVPGGLLMLLAALLPLPPALNATLTGAIVAIMVVVPIVYSWWLWQRQPAQPSE